MAGVVACNWRQRTRELFRDIVILMRDTGMRNERELFRMRIENMDWQNRVIFVPDSKTPEGRQLVPMSGRVFGILQSYQLEFLLQFNSHVALSKTLNFKGGSRLTSAISITATFPTYSRTAQNSRFPWQTSFTTPYSSPTQSPSPYEIAPGLFAAFWKRKTRDRRVYLYGEFLDNLKAWQSQTMMQSFRRFPFMFPRQGRLADAVLKYREQRPKPTQN